MDSMATHGLKLCSAVTCYEVLGGTKKGGRRKREIGGRRRMEDGGGE